MSENEFIPVCEPLLSGNELKYVTEAVSTGWVSSSGGYIEKFERAFADYCGVKHAVTVTNGTVALHLALRALEIGEGDEVIIPDFTMIASAFAVCYTGAKPVFVDADSESWNIDVNKIEDKITSKTKAIMPVHLFGNICSMDVIARIAERYGLQIIEDAAEAHGAEFAGRKAGNLSDVAAFSFFANKNLTTGEGGMVVTNNDTVYDKLKYFKNMCFNLNGPRDYHHEDIGYNYRMSNLHAALGLAQVEKADEYRSLRVRNGEFYRKHLYDCSGVQFQSTTKNSLNVYWMNAICLDPEVYGRGRDELIAHLRANQIDTRLLFKGMHKQASLLKYGCDCEGSYPVSNKLEKHGLYLPSGSGLVENDIIRICSIIKEFKSK